MFRLKKPRMHRALELLIAAACVFVVVYVVSMTVRVIGGVSQTLEPAEHQVRLQVINGCGVAGAASRVAKELDGYTDETMDIHVVDIDSFELKRVPRTMVICRDGDLRTAELLAEKLGVAEDDIASRPLEMNRHHVSITLVLGEDYESLRLLPQPEES